jgi:hypothetical protein
LRQSFPLECDEYAVILCSSEPFREGRTHWSPPRGWRRRFSRRLSGQFGGHPYDLRHSARSKHQYQLQALQQPIGATTTIEAFTNIPRPRSWKKSDGRRYFTKRRQALIEVMNADTRWAALEAARYNQIQFATHATIAVDKLNFRTAVCLLAVCRAMKIGDGLPELKPAAQASPSLCPTPELTLRIVGELFEIGALLPNVRPNNSVANIKEQLDRGDLLAVEWIINFGGLGVREVDSIVREHHFSAKYPLAEVADAISLWTEVARSECKEILRHLWSERNINLSDENKVNDLIAHLVEEFSVSSVYYFLWFGAARTSDAAAKGQVNQLKAPYFALQVSRNRASDVTSGKSELRRFNRNPHLPRSEISYVLFDAVLRIGERGFTERVDHKVLCPACHIQEPSANKRR